MSKVYTDQIEKRTGGTAMDVPASGKWDTANIADDAIDTTQIASGAVGATELDATLDLSGKTVTLAAGEVSASEMATTLDLSGKTVTLPAASVTAHVTQFDDNQLKEEIALLGFRTAANGSLAKYNLVDQTIDVFEDATGIDAGGSTGEVRNASKFYSGGAITRTSFTSTGSDTYTTPAALVGTIQVLVVAGGGGGSGGGAGGAAGGAGGLVYVDEYTAVVGSNWT